MRQHRPGNDVADRENAFHVRAKMLVHFDALLVVELDAYFVRTDAFGKRAATHGHEHLVGFESEFFAAFARRRGGASIFNLERADFGFQMEGHALSRERALQQIGQLEVETESDQAKIPEQSLPSPIGSKPIPAPIRSRPLR